MKRSSRCSSPSSNIDIVLSDVEIPGSLDGFGLARWVRQYKPGLAHYPGRYAGSVQPRSLGICARMGPC